jgi:hypothetical protein
MADFTSNSDQPALHATNTGTGLGVLGQSEKNDGVQGVTSGVGKSGVAGLHGGSGNGVFGQSDSGRGVAGISNTGAGVFGEATAGHGVQGQTNQNGAGVMGQNGGPGDGVHGESFTGTGVFGISDTGLGVFGDSAQNDGVQGIAGSPGRSGVAGLHGGSGNGVFGQSDSGRGVAGTSNTGIGVFGESKGDDGVQGITSQPGRSGVTGIHTGGGNGIFGAGSPAGRFAGDVEVTGDVKLTGGDCAEDFDIADVELVEPGTVMVVGEQGRLHQSHQAYDKRVAGVISGAGAYKPGLVLDKQPQPTQNDRKPIALLGKVYCKVHAGYAPIEVGDLLTTSDTPGYAMKATDSLKAFGAVIGKALRPLKEGQGLVPILISLQ